MRKNTTLAIELLVYREKFKNNPTMIQCYNVAMIL